MDSYASHPRKTANFLSASCFCWLLPIFFKGYKKHIKESDLPEILDCHESEALGDRLEQVWAEQIQRCSKPSLKKAFRKIFGLQFYLLLFMLLVIELVTKLSLPMFLGKLMEYYQPGQTTISKQDALIYGLLTVTSAVGTVLLGHNYMMANQHLGMKIRVSCCSLIYRKCLKLSKAAVGDTPVSELVNILSNDVARFNTIFVHTYNFWIAPVQIAVVICFLYVMLGVHALMGMLIFVVFIPFQIYLGKLLSKHKLKVEIRTERRIRLMTEILRGIQVIKIYAWEALFLRLIVAARKWELKQLQSVSYIRCLQLTFSVFLSRAAIFIAIFTYIATGNVPNLHYIFVLTSFYTVVRQSLLYHLPNSITALAEAAASMKRIEDFLMKEEIQGDGVKPIMEFRNLNRGTLQSIGILCQEVYAKWNPFLDKVVLRNIDLNVHKGELVALVGKAGCGKTSFLQAIIREMPLTKGDIYVNGTTSYASQEPWIFSGTIRENIVFGNPFDERRYHQVYEACGLEIDLPTYSKDDLIRIGEHGANLNRGQRARINLARAVYRDADIYLLDDPLGSVDSKIGWHVFERCVKTFLKEKTVVLVAHQLKYLKKINEIYVLDNGSIERSSGLDGIGSAKNVKLLELEDGENENLPLDSKIFSDHKHGECSENDNPTGTDVYKYYINTGGGYFICFFIAMLFILTQWFASTFDYFTVFWLNLGQIEIKTNETFSNTTHAESIKSCFTKTYVCMYYYLLWITCLICCSLLRSVLFSKYSMKTCERLHNNMVLSVLGAETKFFSITALEEILNRFTEDTGIVDKILHIDIIEATQAIIQAIFIIMIIISTNVWMIIPTLFIAVSFYWLKIFFKASSNNVKRLEQSTKTPVFAHLSTTMHGISTIRASGEVKNMKHAFDMKQNLHSSAYFMWLGLSRSFGFWMDLQCVLFATFVIMSFIFIVNVAHAGRIGLAITQALTLILNLQYGIRRLSDMENHMAATERIKKYSELNQEFARDDSLSVCKGWSRLGKIEFRNLYLRYSPNIFPVLHDISFCVKAKEKVCVVGQPGVGKSSLISAIFSMADTEGQVLIDNTDVNRVPIHHLRQRISVIPQQPKLFSGTLKTNLDPFDQYNEYQLWAALEDVNLHEFVRNSPLGIHSQVLEGGWNINTGQRQLLCLARAILRKNKILILDEIRASIDPETRGLITSILRSKFCDCTVMIIAHRMQNFDQFDKVMVLHDGRLIYYDHPKNLEANSVGLLRDLLLEFKGGHKKGCCK